MTTKRKRAAKTPRAKTAAKARALRKAPAKRTNGKPQSFLEGVVILPIDELTAHPRNYREHTEEQLAHLVKSIKQHGFYKNVVVASDNTILAGHGATQAARLAGMTELPVYRLRIKPDHPRALKILAGDNEIANLAAVDDRALTEMLREIKQADGELLGTGFDDSILANLLMVTRPASEIADIDEAAEWTGMPDFEAPPTLIKLVLLFDTKEDREKLLKKLKLVVSNKQGNALSAWWPPRPLDDTSAVKFDG